MSSGRTQAAPPGPPTRWFEDFVTGEVLEFGDQEISEEEIVEFATRFDPQPFHMDAAAAERSVFGGLVASGWHTGALMMRMMVDHLISRETSMGSPGFDMLRWLQPVRPGDRLHVRLTVTLTRRSSSKPDRGVVSQHVEVLNQRGESVMRCDGMGMYRCRQER